MWLTVQYLLELKVNVNGAVSLEALVSGGIEYHLAVEVLLSFESAASCIAYDWVRIWWKLEFTAYQEFPLESRQLNDIKFPLRAKLILLESKLT